MPSPASVVRAGIACGVLAPLWWVACIFGLGLFVPGYSLTADFISALGARGSPVESVMVYGGFGLSGVLYLAFALAAAWQMRHDRWALGAALLLLLTGVARIATGVYPCDPGCSPVHESNTQETHRQLATAGYLLMMLAAGMWAARGAQHARLKPVIGWAIGGISWSAVCLVMMFVQPDWQGLFQRFAGLALNAWVVVLALCLWHPVADPAPTASPASARRRKR